MRGGADVVIRGGTLIDPAAGVHGPRDLVIRDGRIVAVEPAIGDAGDARVIDARGKLVVPGLIDLHAHLFWGYHGARADEACLARGTTTAADGGSSGANAFALFKETVIERSRTRVRAWLNLSTLGLIEIRVGELMDLIAVDVEAAVRTARAEPGSILGFKVRISEYVAGADFKPVLRLAREAADAAGLPLMVHIGDTNEPLSVALTFLRRGDIVTHAFTGRRHGILDEQGRLLPQVHEAREAGIIFDAAHGRRHFGFAAIRRALDQGFLVDTLSTDISHRAVRDPGYHLPFLMSKLLALGVGLDDVVRLGTSAPARVLGLADELGTLVPGAVADVAILELAEGPVTFEDAEGQRLEGSRRLRPYLTLRAGVPFDPPVGA